MANVKQYPGPVVLDVLLRVLTLIASCQDGCMWLAHAQAMIHGMVTSGHESHGQASGQYLVDDSLTTHQIFLPGASLSKSRGRLQVSQVHCSDNTL